MKADAEKIDVLIWGLKGIGKTIYIFVKFHFLRYFIDKRIYMLNALLKLIFK